MLMAKPISLLSSRKLPGGPQTRSEPPEITVNKPPLTPNTASDPIATQVNSSICFLLCRTTRPTSTIRSTFIALLQAT